MSDQAPIVYSNDDDDTALPTARTAVQTRRTEIVNGVPHVVFEVQP